MPGRSLLSSSEVLIKSEAVREKIETRPQNEQVIGENEAILAGSELA